MTVLDGYFQHKVDEADNHPLLRIVDEATNRPEVSDIVVEVLRPREGLGFKPAKIDLHLLAETGQDVQPSHREDWDDGLNAALVKRKIRAITAENEKIRFTLGLRAALQGPEIRFGDGYFNAVLIHHILNSPFASLPAIESILKHVHRNGIDSSSRSYAECRAMVDFAIRGRAMELVENLRYGLPKAEEILAAAVAQYLDERFSVTNRRIMGLL